jgi:polar amino acid transport system substrate-binding protein
MGISQSQLVVFPDGPSALSGVRSGRVDAYAGTDLTISDLLSKNGEGLEKAAPFKDPVIDGEPVRGYGAFGFRPDDKDFHSAFNEKLVQFRGSPEHLKVVEPFGFGADNMPKKTTEELCKS